jgi:hypothetical protein
MKRTFGKRLMECACYLILLILTVLPAAAQVPPENDIHVFAGKVATTGNPHREALTDPELSPEDLARAYESGFVGAFLDSEGEPVWARTLAAQGEETFESAAPDAVTFSDVFPEHWRGAGEGKHAVYWNYALRFDGDPSGVFREKQITGNCVGASAGVSLTHCLGVAIFLYERPFDWRGASGTVFYAWRGHCGQGANLGTIAAAHAKYGWASRTVYADGRVDLRDTDADQRYGMNHCRQPGTSLAPLWAETAKTPIGKVARFNGSLDELCDLLYAGGSLQTGGRITASRDGRPVSRQAAVGPHAQSCIGYDARPEVLAKLGIREPIFFFTQTWGNIRYVQSGWLDAEWGTMPEGCFILPWSVVRQMLGHSYAYWPDVTGFTPANVRW